MIPETFEMASVNGHDVLESMTTLWCRVPECETSRRVRRPDGTWIFGLVNLLVYNKKNIATPHIFINTHGIALDTYTDKVTINGNGSVNAVDNVYAINYFVGFLKLEVPSLLFYRDCAPATPAPAIMPSLPPASVKVINQQ